MHLSLTRWAVRSQVFEPIDHLHLFGKDPLNDIQLGATYWVATGDSGQGTVCISCFMAVDGRSNSGLSNMFLMELGAPCRHDRGGPRWHDHR